MTIPTAVTVPADGDAPEGVLTALHVAPGAAVRRGQVLAEVTVDKADVELGAPVDGVVDDLLVAAGAAVAAGQTVLTLRPGAAARPPSDAAAPAAPDAPAGAAPSPANAAATAAATAAGPAPRPTARPALAGGDAAAVETATDPRARVERLSPIRRTIARTMMTSLSTTAQLTSIMPVDVTRMMALRAGVKDDVRAAHGVSLSPLAFLARATCMALPRHPVINASVDVSAESATYHDHVGLGMAVDTPKGLVVVNIPDADQLSVTGIARAIADLAARARSMSLRPDDVRGSTFTISNTGSNGTLMGTPILNPPQAAILATYAIQRRPVVIADPEGGDVIAPRSMLNLALTYDHRLVDGADAGRFLQDLRWVIEEHDLAQEL
jgi:pyruvate dehydrogenase E2 component (dihydrolipoamide acetyltransferase)